MELDANKDLAAGQVQNAVNIAVHKKALEQEEQSLKLIDSLPSTPNLPGVGGGVDVSA